MTQLISTIPVRKDDKLSPSPSFHRKVVETTLKLSASDFPKPRSERIGVLVCLLILYISIAVFKLTFFAKIKGHRPGNHPLCYPITCWVGERRSPRDLIWTRCSRLILDGIKEGSNLPRNVLVYLKTVNALTTHTPYRSHSSPRPIHLQYEPRPSCTLS
jgi:hypothetical protein